MSTDAALYVTDPLTLGVDGQRPVAELEPDGCCGNPVCKPYCDTACSFLDLLPTGPMWDRPKDAARQYFVASGAIDPCDPPAYDGCPTMVSYAIYGARVLHDTVANVVWPAIRESRPETAVTTVDDWLSRFGWEDCFRVACADVFYQIDEDCAGPVVCVNPEAGTEHCSASYPAAFGAALKHATLTALARAKRGVIRNLDGLNWIIAPLGAVITPKDLPACTDNDGLPACFCDTAEFNISSNSATLPGLPLVTGVCGEAAPTVAAEQTFTVDDLAPVAVFPGVIIAATLVRSLMTRKCPNFVYSITPAGVPFMGAQ